MRAIAIVVSLGLSLTWAPLAAAGEPVSFDSPGLASARMDDQGRLLEDWGAVAVRLSGEGVTDGPIAVEAVRIDDVIPAARAVSQRGAVKLTCTAFRAAAHPSGVDVLSVRVEETKGQPAKVTVALDVPAAAKIGLNTVTLDKRVVLTVPLTTLEAQELRPWGYVNETTPMPGWAKPEGPCDPAMANIRVGMGGPIVYRFQVEPGSRPIVVLGFCESHWAKPRQRPLVCRVEGAQAQEVDPVGEWGQHKPGALVFRANDLDKDGKLEVAVRPVPGAKDRNTILNAIWLFPPGKPPEAAKVISGELNARAIHYVDAGGENDQSIYPSGKLEYPLVLPAGGAKELYFFLACPNGSAPSPDQTAWTPASLRRASLAVWRDWTKPIP